MLHRKAGAVPISFDGAVVFAAAAQ
eukprot:SAG11_NODE_38368_length_252_cov_1.346405_1_plen_24_part_10